MQTAESDLSIAKNERRKVAHGMQEIKFQKGEVDHEIQALAVKYKAETEQLERIEPVYSTIKKLRALIKEKDLPGFKGLLIDFLEFDPKISSVIDLAAKSKLFSIVVEDLEAAKQVLALNKQIKGGVVNIYPLALID